MNRWIRIILKVIGATIVVGTALTLLVHRAGGTP